MNPRIRQIGRIVLIIGIVLLIAGVILLFAQSSVGIWIVLISIIANVTGISLLTGKKK